jgi:hypothetical protein
MKRTAIKRSKKAMKRTGFKRKIKTHSADSLTKKKVTELGEIAWKLMSRYTRTRDLEVGCITCGKHFEDIKEAQAGHFKHAARTNPVSYDFRNIHAQCNSCNSMASGRLDVYAEKIEAMYGFGVIQELTAIKNHSVIGKDKRQFLYDTISDLQDKIKEQEKG